MNKKLLAAAVVSAFAAPVAMAQPANVTIYGNFEAQVNWASSTDATGATANTSATTTGNGAGLGADRRMRIGQPGGSHIGFRGSENLGGGLSVVWQVESNIGGWDGTGTANTFGSRDSFLGLSSGMGTLTLGHITTPYAALVNGTVAAGSMFGATGPAGTTSILSNGNLAGGAMNLIATSGATTANTYQSSFNRRQESAIQYVSPNFNGLTGRLLMSANEAKSNGNAPTGNVSVGSVGSTTSGVTVTGQNPWMWSASLSYASGPFNVGFAYEKHNEYRVLFGQALGNTGMVLAGRWTSGPFMVNAAWERLSYEMVTAASTGVQDLTRSAFALQGQYSTGPHRLRASYARAQSASNLNFSGGVASQTNATACVNFICAGNTQLNLAGTAGVATQPTGSGANQWSLGYGYALSKRTEVTLFYSKLNNDAMGQYNQVGGQSGIISGRGSDASVFGSGLRHSF